MKDALVILALLAATPALAGEPAPVYVTVPPSSDVTATKVTCGASSTPFGVSGAEYLSVNIPPSGSTVWFAWGANKTATTAAPSQAFSGGTQITWGGGTGSCIVASGTQDITVVTK